jgi:hypothetical protein
MEVLPPTHKFGLTHQGATQDLSSGVPTVVFQTRLVTIHSPRELRDFG